MAHLLPGYDGPCKNIHGHSFKLIVTLRGEVKTEENQPDFGMVMDFKEFKRLINETVINQFDHAFLVKKGCMDVNFQQSGFEKLIEVDYQPTSENIIQDIAERIIQRLDGGIELYALTLYETEKNSVSWFKDD